MNNDLVRRKDVEQMLASIGGCDASEDWERGWDEAIDAALDGLRKVKAADGWIPCSEKLPDDVEDEDYYPPVSILKADGTVTSGCYRNYDKEWFGINREGKNEYLFDGEVIAWQPLPEPWEGEK